MGMADHLRLIIIVIICFSFTLQLFTVPRVRCRQDDGQQQQEIDDGGEEEIPECIPPLPLANCNNDRCMEACVAADAETDRDQCSDEGTCCCNPRCRAKLAYQNEEGEGSCTHAACVYDCNSGGHCDDPNTCCCDPREDDVPGEEVQAAP